MSVTDLKNRLLEVVRRVEKGEVFEITKDGEPVAVLSPRGAWNRGVTGFASVEIKGELETGGEPWTFDAENVKPARKRKR